MGGFRRIAPKHLQSKAHTRGGWGHHGGVDGHSKKDPKKTKNRHAAARPTC